MTITLFLLLIGGLLLAALIPELLYRYSTTLWVRRAAWYMLYARDSFARVFIDDGIRESVDHEFEHAEFVRRYGERP